MVEDLRELAMIGDALLENNPLVIVDVGASGGIDPRWERFTSSHTGILFEPDSREYERLKSDVGSNLIVLNVALSDSEKEIDFNLCKKQMVSSLYDPNIEFLRKFPHVDRFEVVKKVRLRTDTLDNQLKASGIDEIDFIKVDAQGFELSILKGSANSLQNAIGLEVEVEFSELYRKQPLFPDVDAFVQANGFELFDLKRLYWKRIDSENTADQKGQLVSGDALYFRTPEQVLLMRGITPQKIVRAICVYLVYGYLDLAQTLFRSAKENDLLGKDLSDQVEKSLAASEKRTWIPDFRGRARVERFFSKLAKLFSFRGWYSGTDELLGN